MILLLHITIALTSIVVSGVSVVRASRSFLRASYVLIAATLATGTYLTVMAPSHVPSACMSGLLYLAAVGSLTMATRSKLAKQSSM